MPVTLVKSYWSSGNLRFISNTASPTTAPIVQFGQTSYPIQLKVHNRPTAANSTIEVRARPGEDAATHFAVDSTLDWRPASSGTGGQRALQGVCRLDTGYTMSSSASLIGVYGQVATNGTVNGSGIMMAGMYGLIEDGGTYTAVSHVCSAWLDSHLTKTVSAGSADFLYITNNGSTTFNSAIYVYGGNKITNLFDIDTASGMVGSNNAGDATFANWKAIKIDIDGTTHYLIAAQAIS